MLIRRMIGGAQTIFYSCPSSPFNHLRLCKHLLAQRSRQEIISSILRSAEKGVTQTTLMYESYLTQEALKWHLALLLEKGLLEYLAGEMRFRTTPKGLMFLSSDAGVADQSCSHQCKKCGLLYYCKQTNCQKPFHHAVCHRCLQFFDSRNITKVHDMLDKITLS